MPFQIMSNPLNLPQVDSRMINGNRMHLSATSSLIAKGLNTKGISGFILNTFAKNGKNLFSLCHFGVLCVDLWNKAVM
jgi:hypothetical protein